VNPLLKYVRQQQEISVAQLRELDTAIEYLERVLETAEGSVESVELRIAGHRVDRKNQSVRLRVLAEMGEEALS
jgi:hypothetical protein